MPSTEEKPMTAEPQQPEAAARSIAERFSGREPKLDVVPLSAPWRPFAAREDRRRSGRRPL